MHRTAAITLFSSIRFLLGALAAAVPVTNVDEPCQSQTICIDAINSCGIKYGGCYDVCKPSAKPIPPTCPSTATVHGPTTTQKTYPGPTRTKKHTTTNKTTQVSTTAKACPRTICWDGINECGQMYGGCFPDCTPWPTFTPPPCPAHTAPTNVVYSGYRAAGSDSAST
ncbi:hypothetical protein VTK56DRAFT_3377 [Thermocarpiscus australiensis]